MRRSAFVTLLSVCTVASLLAGQGAPRQAAAAPPLSADALYHRAVDAWDAGNYPDALRDLQTVMIGATAADFRDRVAQLTGELFVTTDITPDGRNPKISPNAQFVAYETGTSARTVTHIVRVTTTAPQNVADLAGVSAAFDPSSARVLYLRPVQGAEWAAATDALDAATAAADRQTAQAAVNALLGRGDLVVRDLATGEERVVATGALLKSAPLFSGDGRGVLFVGADAADLTRSDVYAVGLTGGDPQRLTDQPGYKSNVLVDPGGVALVYTVTATATFRAPGAAGAGRAGGGGAGRGGRGGAAPGGAAGAPATAAPANAGAPQPPNPCGGGRGGGAASFGVVDVKAKATRVITGSAPTMSADGSTIAWLSRDADATCSLKSAPSLGADARTLRAATRLEAPSLSPDGKRAAYQLMTVSNDWEIYLTDGASEQRISRDIRHDVLPRFLTATTLLGLTGEPRDRRSYLYDAPTGARTRLFANNTIRTIAPEYIWLPSADGTHLLIQAERDGDTISPERGLYLVDVTRKVSVADLRARLDRQLAAETELRQRETKAYQPIADQIRRTVAGISTGRIYEHEKTLVDFDTKYMGRPGNLKAIDYLAAAYASFGYAPEQQWFTTAPTQAQPQGIRTANVVATLKGTENPDLIYVVGSHFDSVQAGPGADDDTTGTCALLEAARVLRNTPLPATIVFASFTGEEAGDLGSKEFVRLAAAAKWNVVGAINNDMIGWAAESARMDNTIRYSNAGIRDLQHGAAFLFSSLITYDAKYYKGTDASAFFDGWGDIIGGLGSYPVLGNPNYHQATDTIETVNFKQIAESSKVTAATLMYLASSPSRLKGLAIAAMPAGVKVTWTASPEKGVTSYVVAYGPANYPLRTRLTVPGPTATLPSLPAGTQISVKAINSRGLEGWDWARIDVR